MQLFSLRNLSQTDAFSFERPLLEINPELGNFGALDFVEIDTLFGLGQFEAPAEKLDKHADVCCCAGCGNTFDHYADTDYVDASEIQLNIPADITTTEVLEVGVPRSEVIDVSGDRDWFAVTLVAGQTYEISVIGQLQGATPPVTDTFVALYDANGALINSDDDAGSHTSVFGYNDALLTFTAGTTGTYYVEADALGALTGAYIVTVETRADDSVLNGPASAVTIDVGGSLTGTIDYNADQDWFAIELVAGETYEFVLDVEGFSNTLPDGFLSFHDENGVRLAFDDDSGEGLGSRIVYTADTSGTYYISAQGFTGNSTPSTGNYTLRTGFTDPLTPLDAIDWGTILSSNTVSVYFAEAGEFFGGETSVGWLDYEREAALAALNEISEYVNLTFVEAETAGNATFKLVTIAEADFLGSFAPPGTTNAGVGVFVRNGAGWTETGLQKGGFGYVTLIHEFGHGLGLAHPHDTGGNSNIMPGVTDSQDRGIFDLNQGVFTTMSYVDGWAASPFGTSPNLAHGWQATMMAVDLAVLQAKYGASERNSDDTVYTLPDGNVSGSYWEAIWDTGGTDTLRYTGTRDAVLDLREATLQYEEGGGGFLSYAYGIYGGFTIAAGALIENAQGSSGNDTIIGNAANNFFEGFGGADAFDGGEGIDTVSYLGASGIIELNLETGVGTGDAEGDTFINIETIIGSGFSDVITGDGNDNFIDGSGGADLITGGAGNDTLLGDAQNDTIYGGLGDDLILGGLGADFLYGGEGNDQIQGGNRNDRLFGEQGNDKLFAGRGFDIIEGGEGDDLIRGGDDEDDIFAGSGNDVVFGGTQSDILRGEDGDDLLFGRGGFDRLIGGDGNDELDGGFNSDELEGGAGADVLIGDVGLDSATYDTAASGVSLNLVTGGTGGDAEGDTFSSIEYVRGSAFDDDITGSDFGNRLWGQDGSDTINGAEGDDLIFGGDGNDTLNGDSDNDFITGDDGNDILNGGDGFDTLEGGRGIDTLSGDDGGDLLTGGFGADSLTGGTGNDVFVFNVNDSLVGQEDTITDLETGEFIALNTHTFIGTSAFTATGAFEVRFVSGTTTTVQLDRDGDGSVDEAIFVSGDFSFTSDGDQLTATANGLPFDDGLAI